MGTPKFDMVNFASKVAGFEPESERDVQRYGDDPRKGISGPMITFLTTPSQEVIDGILKNHRKTYELLKSVGGEPLDEKWWHEVYVPHVNRRLKGEG